MPITVYDSVKRTISIEGQKFDVTNGYAKIEDLQFWDGNPRIYSLLEKERLENTISKNVIFTNLDNILEADVIEMNLQTKDTKIFMHETKNQVNIKNKN